MKTIERKIILSDPVEVTISGDDLSVIRQFGQPVVATAMTESYAPHGAAMIVSLLENIASPFKCDIVVLTSDMTTETQWMLKSIAKSKGGRLYIATPAITNKDDFFVFDNYRFRIETFFRLFLAEALPQVDRVVYLDPDMVILGDINEIAHMHFGDSWLMAGAPDLFVRYCIRKEGKIDPRIVGEDMTAGNYFTKYLRMSKEEQFEYTQAGTLILNLSGIRREKKTSEFLKFYSKTKTWMLDQDILNACLKGRISRIPLTWSFLTPVLQEDLQSGLLESEKELIFDAQKNPKIIHYAGTHVKPWNFPKTAFGRIYWDYLRKTPWYEEFYAAAYGTMQSAHADAPTQSNLHKTTTNVKLSFLDKCLSGARKCILPRKGF